MRISILMPGPGATLKLWQKRHPRACIPQESLSNVTNSRQGIKKTMIRVTRSKTISWLIRQRIRD